MGSSVWWSLSQAVKTKGTAWNPAALGMRSAGCAPRPDAGAHGAGVATAPLTPRAHAGAYACW